MKVLSLLFVVGAFSVGSIASPTWAQEQATDDEIIVDLATLTCEDMLRASGEDREDLVLLMHGFMQGKSGNTSIDALELGESTDKVLDSCISNTSQSLMGTFEMLR